MKAAVSYKNSTPWRAKEVTLDDPQDHEVLLKLATAEMFHVDLHFIKGDIRVPTPEMHPFQFDLPPSISPKSTEPSGCFQARPPFHVLECRPRIW